MLLLNSWILIYLYVLVDVPKNNLGAVEIIYSNLFQPIPTYSNLFQPNIRVKFQINFSLNNTYNVIVTGKT